MRRTGFHSGYLACQTWKDRKTPKTYPEDRKDRGIRLGIEHQRAQDASRTIAVQAISARTDIPPDTLRRWVAQQETDTGNQPGATTEEQAELRRLRAENKELRRANENLKRASVFCSGPRPPHDEMIRFIDENRDDLGVEAICRVLADSIDREFISSCGYRGQGPSGFVQGRERSTARPGAGQDP